MAFATNDIQPQLIGLDSVITRLEFISATAGFIAVLLPLIAGLFNAGDSDEE